jgi:phosphatidylserine/phosphatidylglycerophosphate/cardiolipin synthase-like enzyme
MARSVQLASDARPRPHGDATLIADADHFRTVVLDGICRAETSIDIMTADFKAMLVPTSVPTRKGRGSSPRIHLWAQRAKSIVQIFRALADAGVEIRLLHAGVPSSAALRELKQSLPRNLTIRRCPRLHAKAVLIDSRRMYLGSANLTGAGLGAKADGKRNFELGIWTESPSLIDAVSDHFNTLWEGRACPTCKHRDICPVPLEEPAL